MQTSVNVLEIFTLAFGLLKARLRKQEVMGSNEQRFRQLPVRGPALRQHTGLLVQDSSHFRDCSYCPAPVQ